MAFSKGNQLFADAFHALLDEISAVMLQFPNQKGAEKLVKDELCM